MNKNFDMHLVINTHWDREWRWSQKETQMRLKEAVDLLIDTMEKDPRFKYFLADSQASFIDDYLEIRPQNAERVKKLVSDGRLLIGPWYTLPAHFLISEESAVRNLLIGHRIAKSLGKVMKVGYNVFSWGQPSQLPQIYRQFGMDNIMFYRGIDQTRLPSLEWLWESPDGSRSLVVTFGMWHRLNFWITVYRNYITGKNACGFDRTGENGFLVHMSDMYSNEMNQWVMNQEIGKNLDTALEGMKTLLGTLTEKSSTNHLLLLQGYDLENPDPVIPDLVDAINEKIDYGKIKISSIGEFLDCVKDSLEKEGKFKDLTVLKGEMLDTESTNHDLGCLFGGVWSMRMSVKLANFQSQIRLSRWGEPSAVWAFINGTEYPEYELYSAWKTLCQNQQHDGIGGVHVDRITHTTLERYRTVDDIAETITRKSLRDLVCKIDFSKLQPDELGLAVFNSLPYNESRVVETFVDIPLSVAGGKSVGGGFGDDISSCRGEFRRDSMLEIYDTNNKPVKYQILDFDDEYVTTYLKYGSHTSFDAIRFKIVLEAEDLPGQGYKAYTVKHTKKMLRPVEVISTEQNVLENEYIKAVIFADGTIDLTNKETGEAFHKLGYFEDKGEEGSATIHRGPQEDACYTTLGRAADVSLVKNGSLKAVYRIEHSWPLPSELSVKLKVHDGQGTRWVDKGITTRSEFKKVLKITTEVTLTKGSRNLEYKTVVDNQIKDHRLRVVFPTNVKSDFCNVDSMFDVVTRDVRYPDCTGIWEAALKEWPSHSFVSINDGASRGISILHAGIAEYEVLDNPTRSIALTLLRCVNNSGSGTDTWTANPLAQEQGEREFNYAVYTHQGDWQKADIVRQSQKFNTPLRVAQTTAHPGSLPFGSYSMFTLKGEGLVYTACKKAEESDMIVFRFYNPTIEAVEGKLLVGPNVKKAYHVTLEETIVKDLTVNEGKEIQFKAGKGEIYSIMLQL